MSDTTLDVARNIFSVGLLPNSAAILISFHICTHTSYDELTSRIVECFNRRCVYLPLRSVSVTNRLLYACFLFLQTAFLFLATVEIFSYQCNCYCLVSFRYYFDTDPVVFVTLYKEVILNIDLFNQTFPF